MSTDTSIPIGLQSLLTELDFISQIERGKKPIMSTMTLVSHDEWWKRFQKYWEGETKDTIMSKVENIINKTVDAITDHKETPYIGILVNKLSDAEQGIKSLLVTYDAYPKTKARINIQIENIELQLKNYRHLIKGYGSKTDDKQENNKEVEITLNPEFFDSSERRKRKGRIKKSMDKQS